MDETSSWMNVFTVVLLLILAVSVGIAVAGIFDRTQCHCPPEKSYPAVARDRPG